MASAPLPRAIAHAATALAAATAGWFAHEPAPLAPVKLVSAPAAPAKLQLAAPLIAVSSDGNVTLRVEQQPLEWVLEQIALQSGWTDVRPRARAAEPAARPAATVAVATPPLLSCPESAAHQVDPARVVQAVEGGSEAERFQGLMLARGAGITLAENTLKQLFETGASERVQVAAFEAYLALRADRPDALRTALEAAQYAAPAPVQREARQRLAELRELQRINALPPLSDP